MKFMENLTNKIDKKKEIQRLLKISLTTI
jgi:hypothetical protein